MFQQIKERDNFIFQFSHLKTNKQTNFKWERGGAGRDRLEFLAAEAVLPFGFPGRAVFAGVRRASLAASSTLKSGGFPLPSQSGSERGFLFVRKSAQEEGCGAPGEQPGGKAGPREPRRFGGGQRVAGPPLRRDARAFRKQSGVGGTCRALEKPHRFPSLHPSRESPWLPLAPHRELQSPGRSGMSRG